MLNFFKKVKQTKITRDQFAFLPNGLRLVNTSEDPLKARGGVIIIDKMQEFRMVLVCCVKNDVHHSVLSLNVTYIMSDGFAEAASPRNYGLDLPNLIQKAMSERSKEWWTKNGVKPDSGSAIFAQKLKDLSAFLSHNESILIGFPYHKLESVNLSFINSHGLEVLGTTSKSAPRAELNTQTA